MVIILCRNYHKYTCCIACLIEDNTDVCLYHYFQLVQMLIYTDVAHSSGLCTNLVLYRMLIGYTIYPKLGLLVDA